MVIHGCESQLHLKTQEGPFPLVAFGPEGLRPTCSAVFGSLQLIFFIILAGDCSKFYCCLCTFYCCLCSE
jgi:hypothetical protein